MLPDVRYAYGRVFQALAVIALPLAVASCSSVSLAPEQPAPATPSTAASTPSHAPALPPAGSGRGGYYLDDGPGDAIPDGVASTPDAEPRIEPYFKRGNQPYVVFGKSYTPFTDDRPYKERGVGSWYGKKFHGQRTSSGELYDMYKMTAAHPTLPLPSYVRVKNVSNGRQVIVRVNDRGPFHSGRIIDLSYTAALKLGYLGQGSTELEVERILPAEIMQMAKARSEGKTAKTDATPPLAAVAEPVSVTLPPAPVKASAMPGFYLQLGAYSAVANAEAARTRLAQRSVAGLPPLQIVESGALHRLYSGPFQSREEAELAARQLQQVETFTPLIVQR